MTRLPTKVLLFSTWMLGNLLFFSCITPPADTTEPDSAILTVPEGTDGTTITEHGTATESVEPVDTTPDTPSFDPGSVSEEIREATLFDIKGFIEDLNSIIQRQDYSTWYDYLTTAYIEFYSNPQTLAELSELFVIRRQGIVLRSLRDYFLYVVYPSRQNDKVDEIEFLAQDIVRAYTLDGRGNRLVLYTLQRIDNAWKITRL
ncbi:MAG: hypothetical protein A2087_00775 [Spirochaetes bacterium GWD1_61_31]|nr:MAG: hypothetical protein A2Y37_03200 [Spirochaetes bacterium GWB1_60_80]OHD29619.1 MAG: hypothetical protein A2004_01740 [Spirochaetes bacterium GWC1_61_12]OHD37522.1 MAG: hypothetical protein A2087_00775 [Spirochaetes bacterium GWD1_61_31]OHD41968.1 MAG: hypothetical protein A2Y35_14490 [Spirochaetes bacterium GWE1_60_18]OHD61766.1 MAG: hypothetical protein A2Y32_13460 [Spirochaetes bacterium GWF1_60_12]